jgi:hypothetical protein
MDTGFYFFRLEWSEIIFRDPWRVAMEGITLALTESNRHCHVSGDAAQDAGCKYFGGEMGGLVSVGFGFGQMDDSSGQRLLPIQVELSYRGLVR